MTVAEKRRLALVEPASQPNAAAPKVSATHDANGTITLRIEPVSVAAPDELVELSKSGLEERAWKALVKSGELPARKIGRSWWSTRSALVRLVLDAPKPAPKRASSTDDDAYAELVRQAGGRR